jgi:hypothetical protein
LIIVLFQKIGVPVLTMFYAICVLEHADLASHFGDIIELFDPLVHHFSQNFFKLLS